MNECLTSRLFGVTVRDDHCALENHSRSLPDTRLLFRAGELLARGQVPNTHWVGRLTALSGGVRGIVAGDHSALGGQNQARQLEPAVGSSDGAPSVRSLDANQMLCEAD